MPGSPTRSRSSALATSFRSGSPNASARNSRRPPRRCARSRSNWVPGGRRKMRSEHGNDDGRRHRSRCRWRTGPSHSRARPPCARVPRGSRRRHLYRRHVRRRRPQPPHAGGGRCPRDRASTATRRRSRGEPTWSRRPAAASRWCNERFSALDQVARDIGVERGRRRAARRRRLVDAARRCGARLLVPARRAARHAHGHAKGRAPPTWSRTPPSAILPRIIAMLGEERHARAVARAIVAARREAPITSTRAARRHRGARRAREARRHPSRDAHVPGAAHLRQ